MTEPTSPSSASRGVDKVFVRGDRAGTVALQGIDLDIAPGRVRVAHRAVRLRQVDAAAGHRRPHRSRPRGEVVVNGKPAEQARLDRDYGMVFQAPVLFDWRTRRGQRRAAARDPGRPASASGSARAKEMLELVELGDFAEHIPVPALGRHAAARRDRPRARRSSRRILLMDEPFGALDEMTRERMNAEVLRIWEQTGTTVVFVTHSIPEAVFLSSRVVVMSARPGRITKVIDIDLPRPRNEDTRESERYFELVTEVREALRAAAATATVRRASRRRADDGRGRVG